MFVRTLSTLLRLVSCGGCTAWLLLSVAGCARPAGDIFAPLQKPLVWPLPQDAPRIQYVGQITGEVDLKASRTGWQVLGDVLHAPGAKPARLVTPQAVAVSTDDVVYVVDTGSAALHVLDLAQRTHRVVRRVGEALLQSPVGVALSPDGVFVTDAKLGEVFEFARDGTFRRAFGADLDRPGGIAYCSGSQRLYVIDTSRHEGVIFDRAGRRVSSFGGRGAGDGQFNYPTHVACDGLSGVVVSDTLNFRVQRFDVDGVFRSRMGKKGDGAGDLSLPKGVGVDRSGHLYVVDAQFENVQIFDADGRLLLAFGDEGSKHGQFAIPAGIAIDYRDRIWVADAYNRRLQVFQYLGRSEG